MPEEEFSFLLNALALPEINLFGERVHILRQSATSVVCVSWFLLVREKVAEGCVLYNSLDDALSATLCTALFSVVGVVRASVMLPSVRGTSYPTSAAGLQGS